MTSFKSESFGLSKAGAALVMFVLLGLIPIAGWRNFAAADADAEKTPAAKTSSNTDNSNDQRADEKSASNARIKGRVLDYKDKSVGDARVFFRGPGRLEVKNGEFDDSIVGRNSDLTDGDGRFFITGGGKEATHIVVLAPHLHAWIVPAPKEASKEELTIRLPQPATLKVIMDIPGAVQSNEEHYAGLLTKGSPSIVSVGKDAWIRLQLATRNMEGWENAGNFTQSRVVANPGELVFDNLTPGLYDFCREKWFTLGERGSGAMCDRQEVKLLPGETKVVRLVRKRGQCVGGEISGLPDDVPGAWLYVRPAEATGDPRIISNGALSKELNLPTFDALTCQRGAKFLSGLLEPGKYKIVAHAYKPAIRDGVLNTGFRIPIFVGTALVTIEDDDPADPKKPAPQVTIEMKPYVLKVGNESKPADGR